MRDKKKERKRLEKKERNFERKKERKQKREICNPPPSFFYVYPTFLKTVVFPYLKKKNLPFDDFLLYVNVPVASYVN